MTLQSMRAILSSAIDSYTFLVINLAFAMECVVTFKREVATGTLITLEVTVVHYKA